MYALGDARSVTRDHPARTWVTTRSSSARRPSSVVAVASVNRASGLPCGDRCFGKPGGSARDRLMASQAALTLEGGLLGLPAPSMCMKKTFGSSNRKWLCRPVTSRPLAKAASMAGVTSSSKTTVSPMGGRPVGGLHASRPGAQPGEGSATSRPPKTARRCGLIDLHVWASSSWSPTCGRPRRFLSSAQCLAVLGGGEGSTDEAQGHEAERGIIR